MNEQAAVFNGESRIFAPRYRQLSQGAQDRFPVAQQGEAMDVAFTDTYDAFKRFLHESEGRPFFLASYSQGTLHAMRILQRWRRSAPANETSRLVAAYLIGNTVPEAEMAGTLPVCKGPSDTRCYVSWNTVVRGDETGSNHWRAKGAPTCVNPLSWQHDEMPVGRERHLGAVPMIASLPRWLRWLLHPVFRYTDFAAPDAGLLDAQCQDGVLMISEPTEHETAGGRYLFNPGVGRHAWDIHLFWMNVRINIRTRAMAFSD